MKESRHSSLRFAFRELRRNRLFTLIFIINLSFGLSGIAFVEQFKGVFSNLMNERSLSILGSDIALGSRLPVSDELITKVMGDLPSGTKTSTQLSMMSMARGNSNSRLVNLSTMGEGFPYYGSLTLENSGPVPRSDLMAPSPQNIWVYPELLGQMGLKIGDELAIGQASYKISDVVLEDPGQTMRMGGFAPKVFISNEGLARANLLGEGATVRYNVAFKIPSNVVVNIGELASELEKKYSSEDIRIQTPTKASEGLARGLDYLTDFLGLVSVVALFLASVGLFYLYRSYLASKRREIAVLSFLGLNEREILKIFSLHLGMLGLLGTIFSLILISSLFPFVIDVVNGLLPFKLQSSLAPRAIVATLSVGLGATLLLCLPLISPLVKTRAIDLLRDRIGGVSVLNMRRALWFLPWLLFCYALSIWMAGSLKVGSLFMGAILVVALLLGMIGQFSLKLLQKSAIANYSLAFKLAVGYLVRFRLATLSLFVALSLSVHLLHLIPQLEESLRDEFVAPTDHALPSLFLFDIQEEQIPELNRLSEKHGVSKRLVSPLVRSRITAINGTPYKRESGEAITREEQEERRIRNRGLNLSYRADFDQSETLTAGRPFSGAHDGSDKPVELSLEERWASRMGVELGDQLTFSIFGLDITGEVVSLRKVRWTSFVPNFFVLVQPGVLEDAPKTFLAALESMDPSTKSAFERDLYQSLSNISSIDVERIIERTLVILAQMAMALKIMSVLSLIVGLLVLYSLINNQMRERARDLVLLKVLGANRQLIEKSVRLQILAIAGFAAFFGLTTSSVVVWLLARNLFNGLTHFNYLLTLAIGATCLIVSLIVGEISSRRWLSLRASEALREA